MTTLVTGAGLTGSFVARTLQALGEPVVLQDVIIDPVPLRRILDLDDRQVHAERKRPALRLEGFCDVVVGRAKSGAFGLAKRRDLRLGGRAAPRFLLLKQAYFGQTPR